MTGIDGVDANQEHDLQMPRLVEARGSALLVRDREAYRNQTCRLPAVRTLGEALLDPV
jgi:hypothetical protein